MSSNYTVETVKPQAVPMVWMVDYSTGELVNDIPAGNRDSDGRFLRQHVELNVAQRVHTAADEAMAERYGVDAKPNGSK